MKCVGPDDCSNQGICDIYTGICTCDPGFQGDMCQGKNFHLLTNVGTYDEIEILYLQINNVLVMELAQIKVPAMFQLEFVFVVQDFKDKPVKVKLFFC